MNLSFNQETGRFRIGNRTSFSNSQLHPRKRKPNRESRRIKTPRPKLHHSKIPFFSHSTRAPRLTKSEADSDHGVGHLMNPINASL